MYQIFADDTLIYDSTLEDFKIGKGTVTLEVDKSGSFVFSIYPDHFYYDKFVRLKTVITVYRFGRILFRGRILNDETDYWNIKTITCEGELGFLQDSVIRPYTFSGTPEELFEMFIVEHNAQVDEFKKFKIGKATVQDGNDYIARGNSGYDTTYSNLSSRLIEDSLGGHFVITHGDDGTDPVPTLNYLADFAHTASQLIEFGVNLKDYARTVSAEEVATAIIPLGHEVDDGNEDTENPKLTIASVNGGKDYVYSPEAVAERGWIFAVVEWDDVTEPENLKKKAEAYLEELTQQSITIELNAIDLRLLDKSIESINLGDYVRAVSPPHNLDMTLLCSKQTFELLRPDGDTLVLGRTFSTLTDATNDSISRQLRKYSGAATAAVNKQAAVIEDLTKRIVVLEAGIAVFYLVYPDNSVDLEIEFKVGMTWAEFVESDYNDGSFTWGSGHTAEDVLTEGVLLHNGHAVLKAGQPISQAQADGQSVTQGRTYTVFLQ